MSLPSLRRAAGAMFLALGAACQSYQPVSVNRLTPNAAVRVALTPGGRQTLAPVLGPNVESVTGTVTAWDSTGVTLRVATIRRTEGLDEVYENIPPVVFPRDAVGDVALRRTSAVRSALLAGLLAGGAIALGGSIGGQSASHQRGAGGQSGGQ